MTHLNGTIGRLNGSQNVATSTTAASSTSFGAQTRKLLIVTATAGTFIAIGSTATTSSTLVPVNAPLVVSCNPGESLSAILASGTGSVNVTELSS